jgi:N,N-dimethylformamidase beta subunit-like, C-terminal/Tachylectin
MARVTRRGVVLGTGAALAAAAATATGLASLSDRGLLTQPPGEPDPEQRFVRLVPGGDGVLYGLQANGQLVWLRHTGWRDGARTWANDGTARVIGEGWLKYRWVLAAADGQLFGIDGAGNVSWHRYLVSDERTGAGSWAPRSGSIIAQRLGEYRHFFGGWNGVIYARAPHSDLVRFQYLAGDGSRGAAAWVDRAAPTVIGKALSEYSFAGPGGLYDINDDHLLWRRYAAEPAAARTNLGERVDLGGGWGDLRWAAAAQEGVIYSIDNSRGPQPVRAGTLAWRRHTDPAAAKVNWAGDNPLTIATDFTIEPLAALQGYWSKLSGGPGDELGLAVSTGHATYSVQIVRLASGTQPSQAVGPAVRLPGRLQHVPEDYRQNGCGWASSHMVAIDPGWASGLYAARLKADGGWQFDIPFAVHPGNKRARIAFLWPTNTYNAYNDWGGHNQYTPGQVGRQRRYSFHRPSVFNEIDGPLDRRLTGDLLLLRWLSEEKIPFDVYHDGDLHVSADWLWHYQALVLAMHPEYWSEAMRSNILLYLEHGGSVIYVGGNGIYERVWFNADATALTFRRPDGQRDLYRNLGTPEHQILGVGYHAESHGTLAPYKVVRDHPLLAGTGLRPGDSFGEFGLLGGASGWEVDRRDAFGERTPEHVFAEGQNPRGGAEMMFRRTANGGWVFSAGSNTFTGAIQTDAAVRRLLRNVFDLALAG